MRRIGMIAIAIMASLVFAGGTFAAGKETPSEKESSKQAAMVEESGNIVSANRFIGWDVKDQRGENIGEVKDLLIDRQNGQIGYIVLSKGGFFGVGDKQYTVPFSAFKTGPEAGSLMLTVDESKLANAPKREPGVSDEEFGRRIHEYYGQAPYWEGTGTREPGMMQESPLEKPQQKPMQEKEPETKSD